MDNDFPKRVVTLVLYRTSIQSVYFGCLFFTIANDFSSASAVESCYVFLGRINTGAHPKLFILYSYIHNSQKYSLI